MYFIYLFSPLWQELNDERTTVLSSGTLNYLLGGSGSFGDLKNTFQVDKSGVPCTMGKKGSVKVVEFVPVSSAANGELITQA